MLIRCKVSHPEHTTVEVEARCRIDAIMQAAHLWDVCTADILLGCSVRAKKNDIEKMKREMEENQLGYKMV